MADDKKVIFSMQKLSKTYQGADKPVLKNIYFMDKIPATCNHFIEHSSLLLNILCFQ